MPEENPVLEGGVYLDGSRVVRHDGDLRPGTLTAERGDRGEAEPRLRGAIPLGGPIERTYGRIREAMEAEGIRLIPADTTYASPRAPARLRPASSAAVWPPFRVPFDLPDWE